MEIHTSILFDCHTLQKLNLTAFKLNEGDLDFIVIDINRLEPCFGL